MSQLLLPLTAIPHVANPGIGALYHDATPVLQNAMLADTAENKVLLTAYKLSAQNLMFSLSTSPSAAASRTRRRLSARSSP